VLVVAIDDQQREVVEAVHRLGERCSAGRNLALRLSAAFS
jgi:hypothetical protein